MSPLPPLGPSAADLLRRAATDRAAFAHALAALRAAAPGMPCDERALETFLRAYQIHAAPGEAAAAAEAMRAAAIRACLDRIADPVGLARAEAAVAAGRPHRGSVNLPFDAACGTCATAIAYLPGYGGALPAAPPSNPAHGRRRRPVLAALAAVWALLRRR